MKKLPIAAAALLFGTSAYAMLPSTEPTGIMVQKDPYVVTPTAEPVMAGEEAWAPQPAAVDWWENEKPVAYETAATDAEFETAAATADDVKAREIAKADAQADAQAFADDAGPAPDAADGEPTLGPAIGDDTPSPDEPTVFDTAATPVEAGTGGPYEPVETAAADVAPRAAAENYPACRPGPGDDRCIQLYEPGVRAELASWTQPTGGFAGSSDTQVAMGGPYEPVDSATETERLNQQALADSNAAVAQMASAEPVPDDSAIETASADDDAVETASADDGDIASYGEPADEDVGEV